MNRRSFIRGFASLAALAVTGPTHAALSRTDRDRLVAQVRDGGLIEGQTFVIDDGLSIEFQGIRALTIRRCNFLWTKPCDGSLIVVGQGCEDFTFEACLIDGGGSRGGPVFDFGYQPRGMDFFVEPPPGTDFIAERVAEGVRWRGVS